MAILVQQCMGTCEVFNHMQIFLTCINMIFEATVLWGIDQ